MPIKGCKEATFDTHISVLLLLKLVNVVALKKMQESRKIMEFDFGKAVGTLLDLR